MTFIKNNKWFISLQTLLFVWYTWRIGYGSATAPTTYWLIVGTAINVLCWYMLFRDLYVPWENKRRAFVTSLIIFCWYCWRIPNDTDPSLLLTIIYEFVDITTWFVAGINLVLLIKGIETKSDSSLIATV